MLGSNFLISSFTCNEINITKSKVKFKRSHTRQYSNDTHKKTRCSAGGLVWRSNPLSVGRKYDFI